MESAGAEVSGDGKRPQFGSRYLTDPRDVYQHNAWDNVEWDEEQEQEALKKIAENSSKPVEEDLKVQYEEESDRFWDQFYSQHQNRFFKDRHWLFTEFPELAPDGKVPEGIPVSAKDESSDPKEEVAKQTDPSRCMNLNPADPEGKVASRSVGPSSSDQAAAGKEESYPGCHASTRFLEVGCGVGNTVFPVLQINNDPGLFVYCCDLSDTAIQLVKEHDDYKGGRCHAFVADVTETSKPFPFPDESLDVVILIFVLSAIQPAKMQATVDRLARCLKPGGLLVFRDYGRYDLAQLRFKNGKCLSPNFYVRGDGTCVYFFTQEELREMFLCAGLTEEVQNYVDRRLQVNRGRQLKMYRVWVQCKYRKPLSTS